MYIGFCSGNEVGTFINDFSWWKTFEQLSVEEKLLPVCVHICIHSGYLYNFKEYFNESSSILNIVGILGVCFKLLWK
jgi:hypothetical protein